MRYIALLSLSVMLLGSTCKPSTEEQWLSVAQFDFTGNTVVDNIQIKNSPTTLATELEAAYQFDFSELQVVTDDNRMVLQVTPDAIISEDGTKLRPVISTQSAYALGLGKQLTTDSQSDSLFYIVQINSAGNAVSEPITFTWDKIGSKWVMGR